MMPKDRLLVGRDGELARFREILEDPRGQAILIVGQEGMGKTVLASRMAEEAVASHPVLTCRSVRYEVTATDPVEGVMELILADAALAVAGSLDGSARSRKQLQALFKLLPKGGALVELFEALRRDVKRAARVRFLEALAAISQQLGENRRMIFIIDPEENLQSKSDQAWTIVVRDLPPGIKLVFPQRPEDALATSRRFLALPNVKRIPEGLLPRLDQQAVDKLLRSCGLSSPELQEALRHLQGHSYAVGAAIDLLIDGMPLDELPREPSGIATTQWERVCAESAEAVNLFQAYAVLEVAVPDQLAAKVAEMRPTVQKHLLAKPCLSGLLRGEEDFRKIYHALLRDHVLEQLGEDAAQYHDRAIAQYRELLKSKKPDAVAIAAKRLPEHVLAAEGQEAFVEAVAGECALPLQTMGLLDEAMELIRRARGFAVDGSSQESSLLNILGLIYETRGDLEKAEAMLRKSLEIDEQLDRRDGMANAYGSNLGLIYQTRSPVHDAETSVDRPEDPARLPRDRPHPGGRRRRPGLW